MKKKLIFSALALFMAVLMCGCSLSGIIPKKNNPNELVTADFGTFEAEIRKSWKLTDVSATGFKGTSYEAPGERFYVYVDNQEENSFFYNITWNKTSDFIFDSFCQNAKALSALSEKSDLLEPETTADGTSYNTGWIKMDYGIGHIYMYIMINSADEEIQVFASIFKNDADYSEVKKETRRFALSMKKKESADKEINDSGSNDGLAERT